MSSESSLTSVASLPQFVEKWERLDDREPLTQLHSRFWGTSTMQEEEEEWRAKERSTSAPGNNRKKSGNGTDKSDDDDEEITPGSYVLNINNDARGIKRIWVCVSVFLLGKSKMSGILMK
jgi:hypothetical protein